MTKTNMMVGGSAAVQATLVALSYEISKFIGGFALPSNGKLLLLLVPPSTTF